MCDCYTGECEGCGYEVPIHIGDFSQSRHNVSIFCPDCYDKVINTLTSYYLDETIVFNELHSDEADEFKDGIYLFLVRRPRSIHLNV